MLTVEFGRPSRLQFVESGKAQCWGVRMGSMTEAAEYVVVLFAVESIGVGHDCIDPRAYFFGGFRDGFATGLFVPEFGISRMVARQP